MAKKAAIVLRASGFPDLVVDRSHGTLLNTNVKHLGVYKAQRDKAMNNIQRLTELESQLHNLQTQMASLLSRHKDQC